MGINRLNHAVLYVRDAQRSAGFYEDVLGFRRVSVGPAHFTGAVFLQAPGSTNDHDLGLFSIGQGAGPSAAGRSTVGLYHLAWEVGTLSELDELRQRLSARGALVGASDHRVSKSLYAKDPSGIEFEVMWRVPAEDWEAEMRKGPGIAPLDLESAMARWGDRVTGAAAGSAT